MRTDSKVVKETSAIEKLKPWKENHPDREAKASPSVIQITKGYSRDHRPDFL
jgi:hypothetical protein